MIFWPVKTKKIFSFVKAKNNSAGQPIIHQSVSRPTLQHTQLSSIWRSSHNNETSLCNIVCARVFLTANTYTRREERTLTVAGSLLNHSRVFERFSRVGLQFQYAKKRNKMHWLVYVTLLVFTHCQFTSAAQCYQEQICEELLSCFCLYTELRKAAACATVRSATTAARRFSAPAVSIRARTSKYGRFCLPSSSLWYYCAVVEAFC